MKICKTPQSVRYYDPTVAVLSVVPVYRRKEHLRGFTVSKSPNNSSLLPLSQFDVAGNYNMNGVVSEYGVSILPIASCRSAAGPKSVQRGISTTLADSQGSSIWLPYDLVIFVAAIRGSSQNNSSNGRCAPCHRRPL